MAMAPSKSRANIGATWIVTRARVATTSVAMVVATVGVAMGRQPDDKGNRQLEFRMLLAALMRTGSLRR